MLNVRCSTFIFQSFDVHLRINKSPEPMNPQTTPPETILVTGGAGYIGSHTCVALLRLCVRPWKLVETGYRGGQAHGGFRYSGVRRVHRPLPGQPPVCPALMSHFTKHESIKDLTPNLSIWESSWFIKMVCHKHKYQIALSAIYGFMNALRFPVVTIYRR